MPAPTDDSKHTDFSERVSVRLLISTYLIYFILTLVAHVRDLIAKLVYPNDFSHLRVSNGIAPLTSDFESIYIRRIYHRIRDCWNRPITGVPSSMINILIRKSKDYNDTFEYTGESRSCINLASYNYLGFSQPEGPCQSAALSSLSKYGVSIGAPILDLGKSPLLQELEESVAKFLSVEAAMVCAMGFATNSTSLPVLAEGPGTIIISDELNHSSLIFGARLSGSLIRVFRHNDTADLERLLRDVIVKGQPKTRRPWNKIIVVIEGLYSMEGHFAPLPAIVQLKEKYKFYLFLDEAHSIGAVGPHGRGICDWFGVDTKKIDILMGTFTKSFGASGGYIAGKKELVDYLRAFGHSYAYCEPLAPPVCQHILKALALVDGKEGKDRIYSLFKNSKYFRDALIASGLVVGGAIGSPVVPMLIFQPTTMAAFSRRLLDKGVAVVVVGYPATPINQCRARFCMTSHHSKEDLDFALDAILDVADELAIARSSFSPAT
ncbi:hypothetical protein DI09_19p110 [Mitosporidium daphniae]|uniref:serine C-palmitoyltransferase n=1 Tax=Mitosporidium daphniae TaxID=1485682 RepID=A0A098VTR9_9MICR|nr:uncharacterized protein DI09_19p110 [Mitosporidium daphniae]KGG52229.1 hypothetical protein DI09_19p110 [Mitosporidium daphniae]|eukprot:XP_013238656.1 uncharacterized protein DI09_19p110 [Mitosporidium daphniae]